MTSGDDAPPLVPLKFKPLVEPPSPLLGSDDGARADVDLAEDDASEQADARDIAAAEQVLAAAANKKKRSFEPIVSARENGGNARRTRAASPSPSYAELRREEAALWTLLSATYGQCRAIETSLAECQTRLQRAASANASAAASDRRSEQHPNA